MQISLQLTCGSLSVVTIYIQIYISTYIHVYKHIYIHTVHAYTHTFNILTEMVLSCHCVFSYRQIIFGNHLESLPYWIFHTSHHVIFALQCKRIAPVKMETVILFPNSKLTQKKN